MSYLVLARKWRPQKFSDVIGQGHVVHTLQNAVLKDRLAHAFLFTGARGVGKTTAARLLAKALQCEQGPTPEPCGVCARCQEIADSRSVDVLEIDGASNRGIDQVRELRDGVRYMPQSARFKLIIIDEVHMLTTEAFNALLKTLEEPPAHVKFIFATTEPHKIPITILSRCQRFDFKRITPSAIVAHMRKIVDSEGIPTDDEALHQIARAGQGSMRDALSLLDQAIAFADERVTAEVASEALGIIDRRVVVAIVEAILAQDASAALDGVSLAFQSGADLRQLLADIAEELRHLVVAQSVADPSSLIDLPEKEIELVQQRAQPVAPQDLQRLFAMALEQIDILARAESPRMVLDVLIARMAAMPSYRSLDELSTLLDRLQGKLPADGRAAAAGRGSSPAAVKKTPHLKTEVKRPAQLADKVFAPAHLSGAAPSSPGAAPISREQQAPSNDDDEEKGHAAAFVDKKSPASPPSKVAATDPKQHEDAGANDAGSEHQDSAAAQGAKTGEADAAVLPGIDPRWQAVVDAVRSENPAVGSFLECGVVDIAPDAAHVTLRFAQRFYADALGDPEKFAVVNKAAKAQFVKLDKLVIEVTKGVEKGQISVAAAKSREQEEARAARENEALANPTVRLAVKMFNAKVLEVTETAD